MYVAALLLVQVVPNYKNQIFGKMNLCVFNFFLNELNISRIHFSGNRWKIMPEIQKSYSF